jgi:hypothetical protein
MVNHNEHRLENCERPVQTAAPCDTVGNIARQAYTENAIVVTAGDGRTSSSSLPDCGFSPLSPKEQREAYVREVAAPLFEGSPPLIAYLDRSSYKGTNREFDGRVSSHNMRDFLKEYETMSAMGNAEWPYTERNAQYVRDLLDFKYPELTGENFAGFSAQALCRRAGLTKMSVKSYDDYAVLSTAWKQAVVEDSSFREDVRASHEAEAAAAAAKTAKPCDPAPEPNGPCDVTPLDTVHDGRPMPKDGDILLGDNQPQTTTPCDVPPPPKTQTSGPCEVAPPKAQEPCEVAPQPASPCDTPKQPCGPSEAEREAYFKVQLDKMTTFRDGGSYWRMSRKLLHAGMQKGDVDDVTNKDINRLTRSLLGINHAHTDAKGLPVPMCHPGDKVDVQSNIVKLSLEHEKLARAFERMMNTQVEHQEEQQPRH